ncbi:hypothetical protein BDN72DRAFT_839473 [Pluteus cervinus]|uniref:Uncharacterized protein n=1 Tax=Pluteus cervinus TaxID=181527 RepID=A0ACD3AVM1_9AGAR|nr:hypothetical protein BDN72DRAFT_839473 [Pluteus cervinus]
MCRNQNAVLCAVISYSWWLIQWMYRRRNFGLGKALVLDEASTNIDKQARGRTNRSPSTIVEYHQTLDVSG